MTKFPPYIFHFSEALTGDYKGVEHSGAWEKMINYCEKENRVGCIDAEYISVYLDDPMTTPAEKGGHFDRLSDRRGEFKVRCPRGDHSRTTKEVPSESIFIYSLEDLLWDGRRL